MKKTKKSFDKEQKKQLLAHAKKVIAGFKKGIILTDDPRPDDTGEYGTAYFDKYGVRFTKDYLVARRDFTMLASKMLKAKSAHEKTIQTFCQKAGERYVKDLAPADVNNPDAIKIAAKNSNRTFSSGTPFLILST
jgi:hypothetical protein